MSFTLICLSRARVAILIKDIKAQFEKKKRRKLLTKDVDIKFLSGVKL